MTRPAIQRVTALIDGAAVDLVAPITGGPVTTDAADPVGPLLAVDESPQLVAGPIGTAWSLAKVIEREAGFARSIQQARDAGHAFAGRLRTQARRRELDASIVKGMTR